MGDDCLLSAKALLQEGLEKNGDVSVGTSSMIRLLEIYDLAQASIFKLQKHQDLRKIIKTRQRDPVSFSSIQSQMKWLLNDIKQLKKQPITLNNQTDQLLPLATKITDALRNIQQAPPVKDYQHYQYQYGSTLNSKEYSNNTEPLVGYQAGEQKSDNVGLYYVDDTSTNYTTQMLSEELSGELDPCSADEEPTCKYFEDNKRFMKSMRIILLDQEKLNASKRSLQILEQKGNNGKNGELMDNSENGEEDEYNIQFLEEEGDPSLDETPLDSENNIDLLKLDESLNIINNFHTTASTYARMIIEEKNLQDKKLRPDDSGLGVAGGKKFKIHDLFFKLPEDKKIGNMWLYGSNMQNDRIASKATNHELKGYIHLLNGDVEKKFNYPLLVLIDFQGIRQTILAQIPISSETLIYGSSDAGVSVNRDEAVHQYLTREDVSQKLNLKPHKVARTQTEIALCTDIEVHNISHNNEQMYFVLDYARILPPTNPQTYANSIFFRLFRPEFLKNLPYPVSSDAYSSFQSMDESPVLNGDVTRATEILIEKMNYLFKNNTEATKFLSDGDITYVKNQRPQYTSIQPKDYFTRKLHHNGINIRYLGLIVLLLDECIENQFDPEIEERIIFILSLMEIRILKNLWRSIIMKNQTENTHQFCLSTSLKIMNGILTGEIQKNKMEMLFEMFAHGILTSNSKLEKLYLKYLPQLDKFFILLRFSQICGIELGPGTVHELQKKTSGMCITQADITSFVSILKAPPVTSYLNILYLVQSASKALTIPSKAQFYNHSILHIEYALGFDFHTDYLQQLHTLISFEIFKFNKDFVVHWPNLLQLLKDNPKELERFCNVSSKLVKMWRFIQSPLRNVFEPKDIEDKTTRIVGTFLQKFDATKNLIAKQCCEYLCEEEEYAAAFKNKSVLSEEEHEAIKSKWRNILEDLNILLLMKKVDSKAKTRFDINEVQYWDIDYDKKWIFLFFEKYLLFGNDNLSNYCDISTKKSLYGPSPIVKSLVWDLHLICDIRGHEEIPYFQHILSLYLQHKVEDPVFQKIFSQEGMEYFLYLSVFNRDEKFAPLLGLNMETNPEEDVEQQYQNKRFPVLNTSSFCERDTNYVSFLLLGLLKTDVVKRFNIASMESIRQLMGTLSDALKTNSSLTSLSLDWMNLEHKFMKPIAEGLKFNNSLTAISLANNFGGDEGVTCLFESLKKNSSVTALTLKSNMFGLKGAIEILSCLKLNSTLKFLDLEANAMDDESLVPIIESLKFNSTLDTLNLTNNCIGMESSIIIGESLKLNSNLKTLCLKDCSLTFKEIEPIFEGLKSNTSLTSIFLQENQILDDGMEIISECLKHNSTLKFMSLWKIDITKTGAQALSNALKVNNSLRFIVLTDNTKIGDEGVRMLSEGLKLNSSLTVLDLRSCGIELNGVPPIVEVLKSNTTLTAIDLSGNMLTHKGTTMIAEGLKLNSTLKQLALKKTSVGVEGATAILESLQSNTTLTKIALEDFNIAPLASKINSLLPPTAPPEKGEMSSGSIKLELNRSFNIETGRFGYGHLFFDGGEGGAITVEVRSNSTLLLVKDKDFENFLLKEMEQMNVEGQLIQLELEKCSTALLLVKSGDLVSKINISNEALSWKTFGYPKLELWELGKLKLL